MNKKYIGGIVFALAIIGLISLGTGDAGSLSAQLSEVMLPSDGIRKSTKLLTIKKTGTGTGTVFEMGQTPQIACDPGCKGFFADPPFVNLRAVANQGSRFDKWSKCDYPVGDMCAMKLNKNKTVAAVFTTSTSASGGLILALFNGNGVASPVTDIVVSADSKNTIVFAFKMSSTEELKKITSLKLTALATDGKLATTSLRNIKLRENSSSSAPIASKAQFDECTSTKCTLTWSASDNIFSRPIPLTGLFAYVTADIAPLGAVDVGDAFNFSIVSTVDVSTKGLASGMPGNVIGTPTVIGSTKIIPSYVDIEGIFPISATRVGITGGQKIGVFKVTNTNPFPIYLQKMTFRNGGAATSSVKFDLYSSSDGGGSTDSSVFYEKSDATGFSTAIPFSLGGVPEKNRMIDGGSWRYLTIKTNGESKNNDTYQLSIGTIRDTLFYAKESEVGFTMNPSSDSDLSDMAYDLWINGTPSLPVVTAKS